jgi:hypothetical protein
MSSLLVVRQVRTDAVDHYHDESAIIHIEPIRTADELVFAVAAFNSSRTFEVCLLAWLFSVWRARLRHAFRFPNPASEPSLLQPLTLLADELDG